MNSALKEINGNDRRVLQSLAGVHGSGLNEFEQVAMVETRLWQLSKQDLTCLHLYSLSEDAGRACPTASFFSGTQLYERLAIKPLAWVDSDHHKRFISSMACYIGFTQSFLAYALHFLQEQSQFGSAKRGVLAMHECLLKDASLLESAHNMLTDCCVSWQVQSTSVGEIFKLKCALEKSLKKINSNITNSLNESGFKREYW